MVLMKNFNTILSKILVIASQKLVSQKLLIYKSLRNNCDIFYDEMVLIFWVSLSVSRLLYFGICATHV